LPRECRGELHGNRAVGSDKREVLPIVAELEVGVQGQPWLEAVLSRSKNYHRLVWREICGWEHPLHRPRWVICKRPAGEVYRRLADVHYFNPVFVIPVFINKREVVCGHELADDDCVRSANTDVVENQDGQNECAYFFHIALNG